MDDGDHEMYQRILKENNERTVATATKVEQVVLLIQGKRFHTTKGRRFLLFDTFRLQN